MRITTCLLAAGVFCSSAFAENGLAQVQSPHDVATTGDRLEQVLQKKA